MKEEIQKIFPSDIRMDRVTFLNNKKTCGQLYSILLEHSYPTKDMKGEVKTYCDKDNLDIPHLAKEVFNCSTRTITNRLKKLEEFGYITFVYNDKNRVRGYYISKLEPPYKKISLNTVHRLNSIFQAPVVKVYIYLGVRFEWAKKEFNRPYNFTKEELIEHCGIPNLHGKEYLLVQDILDALNKQQLIKTRQYIINDPKHPNLQIKKIEIFDWTDQINSNPTPYEANENIIINEDHPCIEDNTSLTSPQEEQQSITLTIEDTESEDKLQTAIYHQTKEINIPIPSTKIGKKYRDR